MIAFSYAVLSLYATWQWHFRYLAELENPIDSAGGMWAFGDLLLNLFLFGLFLIPTFFLLRLVARDDRPFAIYAKVAFAVALTAPLAGAVLAAIHPLPKWAEN